MAKISNRLMKKGLLSEIMKGADVFIVCSGPDLVTKEMVASMNKDPMIFAMSNPTPESCLTWPKKQARQSLALAVPTSRIRSTTSSPSRLFRGTLDVRASDINDEMKIAAAEAIASLVTADELTAEYIIPKAFDKRVGPPSLPLWLKLPVKPA
jgi:malate dehydrogenase (oxaloacetate-decarboxylating)